MGSEVATTDRERTILDLVADPARIGGMGEALAILDAHHQSLAVPVKMIQPIDPRRQRTGPVIARWRVQDNLTAR